MPPKASASPSSVNFATQTVGTSKAKSVEVKNTGGSDLVVSSVVLTGDAEFTQTNNCGTIPPKGSCTINLTYAPKIVGEKNSGQIAITSNDPAKGQINVKVSGQGKK